MSLLSYDVSTYLVFLYSGPEGNSGAMATVFLGIENAKVYLRFYPDNTTLPQSTSGTHVEGDPLYHVSYHYSQLSNVIDILRNEQPVRFNIREDNLDAYLATGHEDVGEGESQ